MVLLSSRRPWSICAGTGKSWRYNQNHKQQILKACQLARKSTSQVISLNSIVVCKNKSLESQTACPVPVAPVTTSNTDL